MSSARSVTRLAMPSSRSSPRPANRATRVLAPPPHPQVVDFCNNYTQLLGMGFSPAVAAGALVRTKNDVTAATDICLASTS